MKYGLFTGAGMVAAGAISIVAGALAWHRGTEQQMAKLTAGAVMGEAKPEPAAREELATLPAPVARYFAFALPADQQRIHTARVRWTGEFKSRPGAGWSPFTADQLFTTSPPGFLWDAQIRMMPLIPVRVRDSYSSGTATMLGRVAGLITVVDEGGTAEIAASALLRWLGEAVWFPTALLPAETARGGLRWEAVDDTSARALLTDGAITVSALFQFGAQGEITGMSALRYRDVEGAGVLTPFEGSYRDYGRRAGVMMPVAAEVAWLLPEGRFPYWRGQPAEVTYETAATDGVNAR